MKSKLLISLFLIIVLLTTPVFAASKTADLGEVLDDLSVSEDNYSLNSKVVGNMYVASKEFEMSSNSSISGNLFVVAKTISLKSDVNYSDTTSKDGEASIESINSKSSIKGNVYAVCQELTMEPGCEIGGDLYIVAESINIKKSVSIGGNLFATSKKISLDGRIQKSAYVSCNTFNMNYYGSINNDLHLYSEEAVLSSIIHRNAFINTNQLETTNNFKLSGNFDVEALSVTFGGEVEGNANISTEQLQFIKDKDESSDQCVIKGNLHYSTPTELEIHNSIVQGETTHSTYINKTSNEPSFGIKDFILGLITFILYVFVIVWLFRVFAKDYSSKERKITVGNTFACLGIGLLSIIVVFIASILLLIINIGSLLSLVLLAAYSLILLLSIPLFVLDIANIIPVNLHIYLKVLLLSLALFLICKIPYAGGLIMFLFVVIGTGRIIKYLITK